MSEPIIVQKRAIDVTPYVHGIWCSVAGSEPFVTEIAFRTWTDDGEQIRVMLETHNFMRWEPNELVDVVEIVPGCSVRQLSIFLAQDAERMAHRPGPVKGDADFKNWCDRRWAELFR